MIVPLMQLLSGPAWLVSLLLFVLGIAIAIFVQHMINRAKAKIFKEDLNRQIDQAKRESENIIKSAKLEAASEAIKKKEEVTNEANRVREELRENKNRLSKREDTLEKQVELAQQREKAADKLQKEVERRLEHIADKDKVNWIRERIEQKEAAPMSKGTKLNTLDRLIWSYYFEEFLATKYTAAKRFGLEVASKDLGDRK